MKFNAYGRWSFPLEWIKTSTRKFKWLERLFQNLAMTYSIELPSSGSAAVIYVRADGRKEGRTDGRTQLVIHACP